MAVIPFQTRKSPRWKLSRLLDQRTRGQVRGIGKSSAAVLLSFFFGVVLLALLGVAGSLSRSRSVFGPPSEEILQPLCAGLVLLWIIARMAKDEHKLAAHSPGHTKFSARWNFLFLNAAIYPVVVLLVHITSLYDAVSRATEALWWFGVLFHVVATLCVSGFVHCCVIAPRAVVHVSNREESC